MSLTKEKIEILKRLLKRLKKHSEGKEMFRDGDKTKSSGYREEIGGEVRVYPLKSILAIISDQVHLILGPSSIHLGDSCSPNDYRRLVADTEEFLAIFEEKGETVAVPRNELERILDTVALVEGAARDLNQSEAVKLLKKAHTKIDELLGS